MSHPSQDLNAIRELLLSVGNTLPLPINGLLSLFEKVFKFENAPLSKSLPSIASGLDEDLKSAYNTNAKLKLGPDKGLDQEIEDTHRPKGPK